MQEFFKNNWYHNVHKDNRNHYILMTLLRYEKDTFYSPSEKKFP